MMVLLLYVFRNGGVLYQLVLGTAMVCFVGSVYHCVVDIVVTIAGYRIIGRKTEYWKLIPRWLQSWIISVVTTVVYVIFAGETTSYKSGWYFYSHLSIASADI